jgi:integrase
VGTGVRKQLLALLVEDVDLKAEEMHVVFAIAVGGPGVGLVRKPTKEADRRDVPLIDSVEKAFERRLARRREQTGQETRPGTHIFAGEPDGTQPIRPDSLSDRLAEARGHSNVTLQDLRLYVATTMLDAGVPYRTVADLLGNSEVTLRLHYDGRTDTGKRDAVKALRRTPG